MFDLVGLSHSSKLDSWRKLFDESIEELKDIQEILNKCCKNKVYFPDSCNIFKAFELTPPEKVKVVIFGQDPYMDYINAKKVKRATGLAFSSNGPTLPPSLKNIYKVIDKDLNCSVIDYKRDNNLPIGDLTSWAEQGVLLLNTSLVAISDEIPSKIWYGFLNRVVDYIDNFNSDCIYMLWGSNAISLEYKFKLSGFIIKRTHPSDKSADRDSREAKSFLSGGQFVECNEQLISQNKSPIDWCK